MSVLLCDIGGTHIRFAVSTEPARMSPPEKLLVDKHRSLEDAVERYLRAQAVDAATITHFYLAYSNRNSWERDVAKLKLVLPKAQVVQCNDFEANAAGITLAAPGDFVCLYDPKQDPVIGAAKVVLGIGTGLGLAYIVGKGDRQYVQKTHGGHMLPAILKPEHGEIFKALQRKDIPTPIYEDVLSGKGLFNLYKFVCHMSQLNPEYHDVSDLLISGKDDPVMRQTLRLFYEILGVFAHQAVAFGDAYGGIYLTGGIIDRLMNAGLFDGATFLSALRRPAVPVVEQDVLATPLFWVRDEFVSLRGLLKQAQEALA